MEAPGYVGEIANRSDNGESGARHDRGRNRGMQATAYPRVGGTHRSGTSGEVPQPLEAGRRG